MNFAKLVISIFCISSINSSEGSTVLVNETINYDTKTKAYILICARSVSYWRGQPRWKNKFQKQSFADLKLGVLKNFVNSTGKHLCRSLFLIKLQTSCNSIKKRLQHRYFFCLISKISKSTFFREELQWLLLRFKSRFQRSSEQKPVRLSATNTRFS